MNYLDEREKRLVRLEKEEEDTLTRELLAQPTSCQKREKQLEQLDSDIAELLKEENKIKDLDDEEEYDLLLGYLAYMLITKMELSPRNGPVLRLDKSRGKKVMRVYDRKACWRRWKALYKK